MSTLAERIAEAIADPIHMSDDPNPGDDYIVIGVLPEDLDELLDLAGIRLER